MSKKKQQSKQSVHQAEKEKKNRKPVMKENVTFLKTENTERKNGSGPLHL